MRIFVTGTGRCGSLTFTMACKHITNYTCYHETHQGATDFVYPDNHIEIDAAIAYFIPYIKDKYPKSKWVHLIRKNRNQCIESIMKRKSVQKFSKFHFRTNRDQNAKKIAQIYYDNTNKLIQQSLVDIDYLEMDLENIKKQWRKFWKYIGAQGNYKKSLSE